MLLVGLVVAAWVAVGLKPWLERSSLPALVSTRT